MNAIENFLDKYAPFVPLVVILMFIGAYVGRTDIVDSCNDLGTFTQYEVTYTCGVAE